VPFTVNVNAAEPVTALTGATDVINGTGFELVTVNTTGGLEVPPPGAALVTVTVAVPAAARSAAGIVATSSVALLNPVLRGLPFQFTTEEAMKLLPEMVRVVAAVPAAMELGDIAASIGAGFTSPIGRVAVLEMPPPGAGLLTVMLAAPVAEMLVAGTMTVTSELLT
jgi:hypothetical protein